MVKEKLREKFIRPLWFDFILCMRQLEWTFAHWEGIRAFYWLEIVYIYDVDKVCDDEQLFTNNRYKGAP